MKKFTLTKYKPICPVVSSKDFEVTNDDNLGEEVEDAVTPEKIPSKRKNKGNNKQISKKKEITSDGESDDNDDEEEEEEEDREEFLEENGEGTEEEMESKKRKPVWTDEGDVKRKPVWVDEGDNITLGQAMQSRTFKKNRIVKKIEKNEKYSDFLNRKLLSKVSTPLWADPEFIEASKSKKEKEDDLTKQSGGFVERSRILSDFLKYNRLTNINKETRGAEGKVISAVEFHPKLQVALVAGQSGVLSLFQVTGGADNPKLAQVKAESFPIRCAHFSSDYEVIAGSLKSKDLFIYNMETGNASKSVVRYQDNIKNFRLSFDKQYFAICGDNGRISLYHTRTKEFWSDLKMNCFVNDVAFSPDGNTLYSHGGTGEIYEWDLRFKSYVKKFVDDGCVKGTRIMVSSNNKLLATGSSSGIVNLYDLPITSYNPKPIKTLGNLTTSISELKFNSTNEILCFSSIDKNDAIKLYNINSKNVFKNFPEGNFRTDICRPNAVDFSPNSGYFAFSNNDQTAYLFRLNNYKTY